MTELQPCPFNMGPRFRHALEVVEIDPRVHQVQCACGAAGPLSITEIDARANWNDRRTHT